MNIQPISSLQEIEKCYEAFLELRPHLQDQKQFLEQVLDQKKEGYQITAVFEKEHVAAAIGYRILTALAWGKVLYIDDLTTREKFRGKGYGGALLDHAIKHAKTLGCDQVHLDTGYTRHVAHRVYLKHGFQFNCHHLSLVL